MRNNNKAKKNYTFSQAGIIQLLPLIVIGVIVVVVVFYFNQNSETPLVSQGSQTPEAMIEDEMADWKTYTNTEWGYSIKFPPNGRTANVVAGNTAPEALSNSRQIEIYESDSSANYAVSIAVFDVLELQPSSGDNWVKLETEVNSVPVTKWTDTTGESKFDVYYIKHAKNGLLEIYVANKTPIKEVADQILSTFEFTK